MTKKIVAIICPTLSRGGAERIAGLLAKNIYEEVDKVYLFLFNGNEITYEYKGSVIDLELRKAELKYKNKYIRFLYKYFYLITEIRKFKKRLKIDCSISFLDYPNIINILSNNKKCKTIISVRSFKSIQKNIYRSRSKKIELFLMKKLYNRANSIVAISKGVENDLVTNFNVNQKLIQTIYNFFNTNEINNKLKEPLEQEMDHFLKNKKIIINVGRLDVPKNHKYLIEEYSRISSLYPDSILMLVGSGVLEKDLKHFVSNLGLTDRVIFIPYTNNPFKYLKKASVFVLSSNFEGFGNVILEAMYSKVPVISTDCLSGPRELIANKYDYTRKINSMEIHNNGILIPCEKDDKKHCMSQAISLLFDDEALRKQLIENAFHFVTEEYDQSNILLQWLNLINK